MSGGEVLVLYQQFLSLGNKLQNERKGTERGGREEEVEERVRRRGRREGGGRWLCPCSSRCVSCIFSSLQLTCAEP